MSHYLSVALGADEPKFRHALMAFERRSGHNNHDIRLTSKVLQDLKTKLDQLGLDSEDTTAEELYYVLNRKLADDDLELTKKIRLLAAKNVNAEANISDGLKVLVKAIRLQGNCLAVKPSVLKSQLKSNPPRKVMKALGYRSVDSMLKLEPIALLVLAINNFESEPYINNFYNKYKKYTTSNLETKKLSVITTTDKKWQALLKDIKKRTGLAVVSCYEMATVVVLPLNNNPKSGYTTMLVANLLSEISVTLSVSSFLKLHQVSTDFGIKLSEIAEHEPVVDAKFLDHPVSWKAAQHVLNAADTFDYAPHVTSEDLEPINLLSKIGSIVDSYKFWENSQFLALVKSTEATSLNVLDVAINLVNDLPFDKRRLDHCRHALIQELMKLYITPEQLINTLTTNDSEELIVDNKAKALY